MAQYLIDTNAVSHYLSAILPQAGIDFMDKVIDATPNLSVISQIELLCWQTSKSSQISEFITDSLIFNITPEVVKICVSIRKIGKSRLPMPLTRLRQLQMISHWLRIMNETLKIFQG
jgi:hypothetical protein